MRDGRTLRLETEVEELDKDAGITRCHVEARWDGGPTAAHLEFIDDREAFFTELPENRRPAEILGRMLADAERIEIDWERPLELAKRFIDVPWEKVVDARGRGRLTCVATGDCAYLLSDYIVDSFIEKYDVVDSGLKVEVPLKTIYDSPRLDGRGEMKCTLPVLMGRTIDDDEAISGNGYKCEVISLRRHLAVNGGNAASFDSLDPVAVTRAVAGILGERVDVEAPEGSGWPTMVLDPMKDRWGRDYIPNLAGEILDPRAKMGAASDIYDLSAGPERAADQAIEDCVSYWREETVDRTAVHLLGEIERDPASFGLEGPAPTFDQVAAGMEERLGMYAVAPSYSELVDRGDTIPIRILLDNFYEDRLVVKSIRKWSEDASSAWNPDEEGIDGAYSFCTAQWICESQGTDLASVVNGTTAGPFAESMREALMEQVRREDAADCCFAVRVEATLGQFETAVEVGAGPETWRPVSIGTVPADLAGGGAPALEIVEPHQIDLVEDGGYEADRYDIASIRLERPIELTSEIVRAAYHVDHPDEGRDMASLRPAGGHGIGIPSQDRQPGASRIKF